MNNLNEQEKFMKSLIGLKAQFDQAVKHSAKQTGNVMLSSVVKRTPVGVYKNKTGGNLRRNWKQEVNHHQNKTEVIIENPVDYGSYVNYGHKTVNGNFVKGQFFLEKAEKFTKKKMKAFYIEQLNEIERNFNQ